MIGAPTPTVSPSPMFSVAWSCRCGLTVVNDPATGTDSRSGPAALPLQV
jgi:hypothetical protein